MRYRISGRRPNHVEIALRRFSIDPDLVERQDDPSVIIVTTDQELRSFGPVSVEVLDAGSE